MSHTTYNQQRSAVSVVLDNRLSYVSFGLAWLVGHGVNALTHGDVPSWTCRPRYRPRCSS